MLYVVHASPPPELEAAWAAYHLDTHLPAVVAAGRFSGAARFRHVDATGAPLIPSRYTTLYIAPDEPALEAYLRDAAPRLRAEHDAFLAGRPLPLSREIWRPRFVSGEIAGARAAFVVRVHVAPESVAAWERWYDAEHIPAVVAAGRFTGALRSLGDDGRFAVLYAAPDLAALSAFRSGPGPALSADHERRFAPAIERELWSSG